jgi:lipid A 3-O-deacylase
VNTLFWEHLIRFAGCHSHASFFTMMVAWMAAWVITPPIFQLGGHIVCGKNKKLEPVAGHGRLGLKTVLAGLGAATLFFSPSVQAQSQTLSIGSASADAFVLRPSNADLWPNGVGQGIKSGAQSVSLALGAGYGLKILGSTQSHDLAWTGISYGYMLGSVEGEGHWYRGNWELRAELFGGAQFSPTDDWLVGLAPHLRYDFMTGTRWIPYLDAGAGVSATGIGPPDLSHGFEFNLQAAAGVRWFIKDNLAINVEARYLHMSCAGLNSPNLGLNNVGGTVGISCFF